MANIDRLTLNGVQYTIVDSTVATQIQNGTANFFDGAVYDSNSKRINFYHGSTSDSANIKAYIDATAFVKDGMVDNVEISNGYLVITFNTDAGKQAINIAISDIFDATNYYTKTEVDTALAAKANASSLATVATSGDYDDLTNKPTIPAAQIQSDWNQTDNTSADYIKNKPNIPAGVIVDSALSTTSENPVQNKVITSALGNKANSADLASVATSGAYSDLSGTPFIPTITYDAQNTALVINTVAPAQS